MERVDLASLLVEWPIIHPTKLEEVVWRSDDLSVVVSGYAWWKPNRPSDFVEGRIRFAFSGIAGGLLQPSDFQFYDDEALEDFSVDTVASVPWAQPAVFSVFCSEPIPQPLKVYTRIDDYLTGAGSFKAASDFLNQAGRVSSFLKLATSSGFLVGRGPEVIQALLCDELEAQGVRHNVVGTPYEDLNAYVVTLGGSAFICRTAVADLDWE